MKKAVRFLRGFSFFCLCFFVASICGAGISSALGVADGQGLAGGAIVFWYALLSGLGGLIVALLLFLNASITTIKRLNILLFITLLFLVVWLAIKANKRANENQDSQVSSVPNAISQPRN